MHLEQHSPAVFDLRLALARLDGDAHLLAEVAAFFVADWPKRLEELCAALAGGNNGALERAAHEVKGAVAVFGAGPAFAAAQALETMGHRGHIEGAEEAFRQLEHEGACLCRELEQVTGGFRL